MYSRFLTGLGVALLSGWWAFADCAMGSFSCWPNTDKLPVNGVLVLTAAGAYQATLDALAQQDCRLSLVSDGDSVPLAAEAVYVGSYQQKQLVLRPQRPLTEGASYGLRVTEGKSDFLSIWLAQCERMSASAAAHAAWYRSSWTIGPAVRTQPAWEAQPRLGQTSHFLFGCGPAKNQDVKVKVEGAANALVLVKLDGKAGDSATQLLPIREGKIGIGHGMCYGGFKLAKDVQYSAELTLVGASGALGPKASKALTFSEPKVSRH